MLIATNIMVAQNSPTEITFISANFLFKINGAIKIDRSKIKKVLVMKMLSLSGYICYITSFAVSLNTLRNITRRPKLFTMMIVAIQNILDLPIK